MFTLHQINKAICSIQNQCIPFTCSNAIIKRHNLAIGQKRCSYDFFRLLHVLDIREREDGGAIEAVAVPPQPVLVRLPLLLLLLVLLFPVRWSML